MLILSGLKPFNKYKALRWVKSDFSLLKCLYLTEAVKATEGQNEALECCEMLDVGRRLFAKIHKQKYHAHHNHELHFMAREINDWLPQGIQSIVDGSYNPRCLKRYLHISSMHQAHLNRMRVFI